ncbi:uncharacterized protein B0H18DRAFT_137871 [Fomitopsis serialis]|uniref:uncharacterized protein n=1 Tax=Fomitopsis serialis TaxID=139415 RepID=UPI002007A99B|nr:uncharacterized protein B0H18DRAFT_137871 [Neoantrodia serialis]KAH9914277.1 hypothetical protein B0H18DRAFT_137871 [Neoantrodia serialis]
MACSSGIGWDLRRQVHVVSESGSPSVSWRSHEGSRVETYARARSDATRNTTSADCRTTQEAASTTEVWCGREQTTTTTSRNVR